MPWLTRAPSQVIADQIRFVVDAAVERDASTWLLAGMLPPACLVWGSDAPFAGGGSDSLAGSGEELRERVLGANALDAFRRLNSVATVAA